jgi:hypothetical protein
MFKVLIPLKQKYLQTPYYFLGRLVVCAQTALFFNTLFSKKAELYILCMDGGSVSQMGADYGLPSTFTLFLFK